MTGYCKYCGQSFMTDETEEMAANYTATMNCKCDKALEFKRVENMKEMASNNARELFQDQSEAVIDLLIASIEGLAERHINQASFKINSRISATIAKGKDGIIVKRKYTEENTLES